MESAATPVVPASGTTPAAPAATPAVETEKVTLTKEQHDQLLRDAARGSTNQRKADLYDRTVGSKGNSHFRPQTPPTPPTEDEKAASAAAEDRKAERGLMSLALDPAYRQVLDSDPTLRDLLTKNPLAILPVLAPDALDADDAVSLVREALEKRKTPAAAAPATPAAPVATPPIGGINPTDKPVNDEVEQARKNPNAERAVAGMIGARLRANAGKKP